MTAVGHLSTGLLLKGRFRDAPLPLLLWASAAPDILWALLNLIPSPTTRLAEITRLSRPFTYIGDQHMLLQPWSHALLSQAALGVLFGGLTFLAYRRWPVAGAVFLAVLGHWLLDFLVHDADLTLWPWATAPRVGPPFSLDPAAPTRGLAATAPLVAFALQTMVVLAGTLVFVRGFPTAGKKGPRGFVIVMLALVGLSLPLHLRGALTGRIDSTQGLVWGALAEMLLVGIVIDFSVRRTFAGFLGRGPFDGDNAAGVAFVKRVFVAAGAAAFVVATIYLAECMLGPGTAPRATAVAMVLALVYAAVGLRFIGGNPSTVWAAAGLCLIGAPILRVCFGTGRLALPATVAEVGLGLLCVWLLRTLLRRDLLL